LNALPDSERRAVALVDIIDLKWLLAGEGVRLHVERLQGDPVYAAAVLAQADGSGNEALRAAAGRVRGLLAHLG
jgi:hypothetical protein